MTNETRCAWCEDTGGGVTPAWNVEEHFGPMLAARLVAMHAACAVLGGAL